MLATMPCTPFPGRTAFGFESVVTHDFPGSTGEDFYREILRKGPEKKVPVETVDGEGTGMNGVWGREWKRERGVEIVVVVE